MIKSLTMIETNSSLPAEIPVYKTVEEWEASYAALWKERNELHAAIYDFVSEVESGRGELRAPYARLKELVK